MRICRLFENWSVNGRKSPIEKNIVVVYQNVCISEGVKGLGVLLGKFSNIPRITVMRIYR